MAIVLIQEPTLPITAEMYDAVNTQLDMETAPPDGLIAHTAGADSDGQWRIIDVWESQDAFDRFLADKLGPAIEAVSREAGMEARPPKMTVYEAHHVMVPAPVHSHA
ncbi:MAG: hypothetical protein QOE08_2289 [Thermoleophilaceae bacterium]|nr:hypothetical protein [Thermoleophilaceae bacterium]